jgi:hypothetical protein
MNFAKYLPSALQNLMPGESSGMPDEMPQDDAMMQLELQRRMKFADALRQQEAPQGQMVSGIYVAPSWTQQLAGLANKYVAGKQEKNAMKQYGDYQAAQNAKLAELLKPEANLEPSYNESGNQPMINETQAMPDKNAFLAKALQARPDLAPKLLEMQLGNMFTEEKPMTVSPGARVIDKQGNLIYENPKEEIAKSKYANVQQDPQTGKMYGVNITTNVMEEIPGAAMTPKPAMTAYEQASLGLRRQEINKKEDNNFDSETIDMLADQALTGDKSVFSGRGMTGANLGAIRQRMNQKMRDRGMTGADIAAANAQFMGFGAAQRTAGVKGANVQLAGAEFQGLLPLAQQASMAVSRSKILPFGKVQIMFNEQTNDPALREFAAVNNGIINTYARAISPTGVPTVSDKDHARKILSTAFDQKSYQATLNMLNKEIAAAMQSPIHVRESLRQEITGRGASNTPRVNAKGWTLKTDKAGNKAYVSPDGTQFEEVR